MNLQPISVPKLQKEAIGTHQYTVEPHYKEVGHTFVTKQSYNK